MATTRTFKAPPVLASNAETTIPTTPIAGASYRDETTSDDVFEAGYRYNTIVDSATIMNQFQFLLSQMVQLVEQSGVLGWSNLVDYPINAFCVGSDGALYQSVKASGPNNGGAQDPTLAPAFWGNFADSVLTSLPSASESAEGKIRLATQDETNVGTNSTKAITPGKLANVMTFAKSSTSIPSRMANVVYTNTTGKPLQVNITARHSATEGGAIGQFKVNDFTALNLGSLSYQAIVSISVVVPRNKTYELALSGSNWALSAWCEMAG